MGSEGSQPDFHFKPVSLKDFETVFPKLVDDLSQHCKQYGLPEDALNGPSPTSNSSTPQPLVGSPNYSKPFSSSRMISWTAHTPAAVNHAGTNSPKSA
ncbi:MAG: hypothetical protein Q9198_007395 [Flavoplaca austrocitrina]